MKKEAEIRWNYFDADITFKCGNSDHGIIVLLVQVLFNAKMQRIIIYSKNKLGALR
jgi:hypothetical protein